MKIIKLSTYLFIYLLMNTSSIFSQNNKISGVVIESKNNEPITGAHVFFDNTTIGTITDESGKFSLSGIQPGIYKLVITYVGYITFEKVLSIPMQGSDYLSVKLEQDQLQLERIEVKSEVPREWLRNLKKFEALFLGDTSNALQTEIENPHVLEFTNEGTLFKATAGEPLLIYNHALGYEITYFLKEFVFENNTIKIKAAARYKEMATDDSSELEIWARERKRSYFGSFKHFINSLQEGAVHAEGFRLYYQTNRKIITNSPGTRRVDWPQYLISKSEDNENVIVLQTDNKNFPYLRVDYLEESPEKRIKEKYRLRSNLTYQSSFIYFPNEKAVIDLYTTNSKDPYVPLLYGYWGWTSRIPDLLPQDFSIEGYEHSTIK